MPALTLPTATSQPLPLAGTENDILSSYQPGSSGASVMANATPTTSAGAPRQNPATTDPSSSPQDPAQQHSDPPTIPISLSENPDAIALRSALSILQIQRERSIKDIRALETLKGAAARDPKAFVRELRNGRVQSRGEDGLFATIVDDEDVEDEEDEESEEEAAPPFGAMPAPQNIVRCPPVNWAKYHVVGESLDKLHREQQLRPMAGEPARDYGTLRDERPPEHVIAAPYRPFVDKLDPRPPPMRTRSSGKKDV